MPNNETIPTHVGLILDGNRRWARQHGLPTLEGHQKGFDNFKDIAFSAFDRGIKVLSAFIFSTENWKRTEEEVGYLMRLVTKVLVNHLDEFKSRNVKILVLGRRDGLNKSVRQAIEQAESTTADNTAGTLALCFNYGGREELVDMVKNIIAAGTQPNEITVETLKHNLYNSEVPDVDLIIRTSGEHRLSGFMLARSAYSEIYFNDKYWPDFSAADLDAALADFANRERRFGG